VGDAFGEVARNPDEAAVMVAQQDENVRATRIAQVVERIFFDAAVFHFVNVELQGARECVCRFLIRKR
jgi:hypothetical protein